MTRFKHLRMWKDTGYTDGSTEIPPLDHVLKPYDILYSDDITPSKERLFNEMQIKIDYLSVMDMSYLAFTLDMNNGADMEVYGWIDDIRIQSDSEGFPMTLVDWHVDVWRTFAVKAVFGSGTVVRRPHNDNDYWQGYSYIYKDVKRRIPLVPRHAGYWWILMVRQVKNSEEKVSRVEFITYPVYTLGVNELALIKGSDSHHVPNFYTTITAGFDERLGFDPETITGCWIMPFAPISGIEYTSSSEITCTNQYWKLDAHGYLTMDGTYEPDYFGEFTGSVDLTATELEELRVTGFLGESVGQIPYGRTIRSYKYRVRASSTEAVIEFRFNGISSNAEGTCFDIPLPSLDVNSNSWSSYVMSGQRDYEIQQRNLKSQQQMVSGALEGAATGAMFAVAGGVPAMVTKSVSYTGGGLTAKNGINPRFAGSLGVGAASSLIGGMLDMGVYNDQFQRQEDKLHASQPDSILFSGLGGDIAKYGDVPAITVMMMDEQSEDNVRTIRNVQGVSFGMPMEDCTLLISGGGPMQIDNLIVRGDIPTGAKKWIKEKFASGVRIIART